MRTSYKIKDDARYGSDEEERVLKNQRLILEVLLDIRDLLINSNKKEMEEA